MRRRRNRCRKPSWRCWRSRGAPNEPFHGEPNPAEKELWKCRVRGKSGKPKAGFPLFPPPLGNLANPARFPHSHARPATVTAVHFEKSKPNRAASGGPRTNQKRRASHSRASSPRSRISGSPRIGNEIRFQAHSALEINIDFRLTFGLENAVVDSVAGVQWDLQLGLRRVLGVVSRVLCKRFSAAFVR